MKPFLKMESRFFAKEPSQILESRYNDTREINVLLLKQADKRTGNL